MSTTFGCPILPDPTVMGCQRDADARYFGVCLPLRVLGGTALAIAGGQLSNRSKVLVQSLIVVLLITFIYSGCCGSRKSTWKNYVRPSMALTAALVSTMCGRWDIAGVLIAADGMVGLQGRHTAAMLGYGATPQQCGCCTDSATSED